MTVHRAREAIKLLEMIRPTAAIMAVEDLVAVLEKQDKETPLQGAMRPIWISHARRPTSF